MTLVQGGRQVGKTKVHSSNQTIAKPVGVQHFCDSSESDSSASEAGVIGFGRIVLWFRVQGLDCLHPYQSSACRRLFGELAFWGSLTDERVVKQPPLILD